MQVCIAVEHQQIISPRGQQLQSVDGQAFGFQPGDHIVLSGILLEPGIKIFRQPGYLRLPDRIRKPSGRINGFIFLYF